MLNQFRIDCRCQVANRSTDGRESAQARFPLHDAFEGRPKSLRFDRQKIVRGFQDIASVP